MSRHILNISRIFAVSCMLLAFVASPAMAQTGFGDAYLYTIKGTDTKVNASGRLPGYNIDSCPFKIGTDPSVYDAAFSAAKGGDPDSCPYAEGNLGRKIYLGTCERFYNWIALSSTPVANPEPDPKMMCCYKRPGAARNRCVAMAKQKAAMQMASIGNAYKQQSIIPDRPGYYSQEVLQEVMDKKKEKAEADRQCFEGTLDRIGEYWAKQRSVACISYVTSMVKSVLKNGIRDMKNDMQTKTTIGSSSTMTQGAATAVVSTPSVWGAIQVATSIANFAADVISLASDISDMTNALTEKCGNIVGGLKDLQQWRRGLGGGLCQAAESLVERQLTQCIRVNVGLGGINLRLPQFAILMQCPVQVNIAARVGPSGFGCYSGVSATVGSPVVVGGSGRPSMLSGNGGLENLFNGGCFKNTTAPSGTGGFGVDEEDIDGRMPGVDCAALDEADPQKKIRLQGQVMLSPGYTDNGWAVGGSEVVSGVTVTRCDQYTGGNRVRTNYVYGSGASCNAGTSGFLSGGYETNTSCYASIGGGYTPAPKSNIPDACMYDVGCLDANGKLDAAKLGKSGCATGSGKNPNFDETRVYKTFVSGGFGGGETKEMSCKDFSAPTAPVLCCDPQKQDCSTRDVNVPLCVCDEGDASNKIKVDPATGAPDARGMCEQGGRKTCCSPRLNGGIAGCQAPDIKALGLEICPDEQNSCLNLNDPAKYTGPDGKTTTYTAQKLATSKPTPYLYIFVRPDVELSNGQQCCTTEWCNVCPQHYVNAYGLSLVRADSTLSDPPRESDNQKLLANGGRFGWPFIEEQDEIGNIEYKVGAAALPLTYTYNEKGDWTKKIEDYKTSQPPLHISDMMKLPANLNACNQLSSLRVTKQPGDHFKGSTPMGFTFNEQHKRDDWKTYAGVPEPREYPLDYMNRLRGNLTDSSGMPLPPIQMCGDIKLCVPETSVLTSTTTTIGGTGGMTGTWTGTGTTTTTGTTGTTTGTSTSTTTTGTTTTTTGTPTSTTSTTGTSTTPSVVPSATTSTTVGTTGGPTPVPSAGGSSTSGSTSSSTGGAPAGLY